MLTIKGITPGQLADVKRYVNITWSDDDTDLRVMQIMVDAEAEMDHLLGAEIDYFAPGAERRLYLDYCLYAWNKSLDEFEEAYRRDILRVRHKYEVARFREKERGS